MLSKGLAKEGSNIFGSGSMTGISITILVKSPLSKNQGSIFYHDIGDDLTREEKLEKINQFGSIDEISQANHWSIITPDEHGDWLRQRNNDFSNYLLIGTKKKEGAKVLFDTFSNGVVSGRDSWVFNFSKEALEKNCKGMIDFYNSEIDRYSAYLDSGASKTDVQAFVQKDPSQATH